MIAKMFEVVQSYQKILDFLGPYRKLWESEILNEFPRVYAPNIETWATQFQNISLEAKARILSTYTPLPENNEHRYFIETINELITLPQVEQVTTGPIHKVSHKKSHEIQQILRFYKDKKINDLYDFAGGVGHTSEQLSKHLGLNCTCLDLDKNLIQTGKKRTQRVTFKEFEIKQNMDLQLKDSSDILGLHCCGELSDHLINFYSQSQAKSLLNLGCCYHKMKQHSQFSNQARYLATRSHAPVTADELEEREQFKTYRYSFELLLKEYYQTTKTVTLKSSLPELYQESFTNYSLHQLQRLDYKALSLETIDDFFNSRSIKEKVARLINLGHVRAPLGRVIEVAIILERVIELQENGKKVEVFELFDRGLSPRNIALYAQRT